MFDFSKVSEVVTNLGGDPALVRKPNPSLNDKDNKHAAATINGNAKDPREKFHRREFAEITLDTPLRALSRFFEWNSAAVVTERDENRNMRPVAVVTKVDLLAWLVKQQKNHV